LLKSGRNRNNLSLFGNFRYTPIGLSGGHVYCGGNGAQGCAVFSPTGSFAGHGGAPFFGIGGWHGFALRRPNGSFKGHGERFAFPGSGSATTNTTLSSGIYP
jgi:hypothetical protein